MSSAFGYSKFRYFLMYGDALLDIKHVFIYISLQ